MNLLLKFIYSKFLYNSINFLINEKKLSFNNTILLVGHNSDKQGAALLLKYIAKEMVDLGFYPIVMLRSPGDLTKEYIDVTYTYCFVGVKDFECKIKKYFKKGVNRAIVNTTVNGDLVSVLKKNGYMVETLVHEMPTAIINSGIEMRAASILHLSDVVVFPSSFVKDKYSVFGEERNVIVHPQGLYLTKNHRADKEKIIELRTKKGLLNRKVVINVATGEYRKGFDIFLRVAKSVSSSNIMFIWIGPYDKTIFSDEGGDNIQNLIMYGYVNDPEELATIYDIADILLLTSREEPFGSIVLEAFNSGTPVVGFKDAGGFVDTVIPGYTGELAEYLNERELTNMLLELIQDEKKLLTYSKNCKEFVKKYDFKEYVKTISSF